MLLASGWYHKDHFTRLPTGQVCITSMPAIRLAKILSIASRSGVAVSRKLS